ncbi:MAG: ribonucleoside-diphosphate reductase subunit alpha, partial [Piscirickettsiaceae bacterium]|nr:ribonucleoside-diphosphate reductase subunit alpha [Piscirickettsiaceae bacterium]
MQMNVVKRNGDIAPLDIEKIHAVVRYACEGLEVSESEVEVKSSIMFFDGIKTSQIHESLIKSAAELISVEGQDYTFVASRLLLQKVRKEVTFGDTKYQPIEKYIVEGIDEERLTPQLLLGGFDLEALNNTIVPDRDLGFAYLGMQTIYDRYLIRRKPARGQENGDVIEMPQHMWMRVAMGLALNEERGVRTAWAIEFYNILSQFEFISSTPTLFNAGTLHPQMSSCFLNTVSDDLEGIFNEIKECAHMSKWSGGIGTDWTRVRPAGDLIHGTNGKSSGIVPYLKIFNDTAVAVNQGGKRNGAFAAYLEPWHGDVLRFIDLKKNAGDERLRAREIFTAGWFPDLFFERLEAGEDWSLFSPKDCPELHELYGDEFKIAYENREEEGLALKVMPTMELWKGWMSALWESGGPWITFKDEVNRRNPQDHIGTIHNSNLCTEITEVTNDEETAVCNLGSINASKINSLDDLKRITPVAMRMLDNVIDLNFYPVEKARNSNMKHRPVGLGVMGWTEYVVKNGVDWESQAHLDLTNTFFEYLSYEVISASMELAKERGAYPTFKGSKWSRGILPIDTARDLGLVGKPKLDWATLRAEVMEHGMRN